ncbi:non-ribosomal peptide synthetase [Pseudomonas alabamensis]|uniref:non-ribosomal peptide synthetase n=1 Tax=Pseudomonas alabamensis TaxID=3064349 RepID=UPI003F64E54A
MSDTLDTGLALLPQQAQHLDALTQGAPRAQTAHCLRIDIDGPLQVARLQHALGRMTARHTALGLRLAAVPGYHGMRQFLEGEVGLVVLQQMAGDAAALTQAWLETPSNATSADLQALLLELDGQRWQLLVAIPRHAADAGSLAVLFDELVQAFVTADDPEAEAPGQFAQYLEWRAEVLFDEDAEAARQYWQGQKPGEAGAWAPVPAYRQGQGTPQVHRQTLTLDGAQQTALGSLAEQLGTRLDVVLQAAWWALLGRFGGRERFTVAWRHDARADYEFFADSIGVFEKTLPLTLDFDASQDFARWVGQLAGLLEQHTTWQEYAASNLPASVPGTAVGFAARRALAPRSVAGARWRAERLTEARPPFELQLQASLGATLELTLDAQAGHYSQAAVQVLLEQYQTLLGSLVADRQLPLGRHPLTSTRANQASLDLDPPLQPSTAPTPLAERIAQWAKITPDATALIAEGVSLSYAELNQQVVRLAAGLAARGIKPGDLVALALPRSAQLVVALLASWRLGAGYLPLDPQWPLARQVQMIQQADACVVLTRSEQHADFAGASVTALDIDTLAGREDEPTGHALDLDAVAYVLFTSGSSGMPKGVVVEQRQLLNYTAGVCQQLALEQCRHFALSSSVAADLGNTTLFAALYLGATLHIADDTAVRSPDAFADFIREQRIDCVKIVPSHLSALLDAQSPVLPATLVLGGEALSGALVQRLFAVNPQCRVFNHYGPTETTVGVLVHPVQAGDCQVNSLPLTQVLPNNRVLILDAQRQRVACGELGELYIGGEQLARGYLGAPEQTAEAFIALDGERFYRTGDLARYRPEGGLQLYGRADQQVKINGFRVELAEIEAQLISLPGVGEAAVVMVEQADGTLAPVAYVVVRADDDMGTLAERLATRLPAAMLPRQVLGLAQMPRLANGKIDRQALRERPLVAQDSAAHVAPRDALETLLADRMAQLLGLERLSVEQDFFGIGGHSLLVIKLVAGIRKLLHCEVHPGVVFDNPSVAELAQALRLQETAPGELEKRAAARLHMDAMSPEEKARLLEKARQAQTMQS